MKEILKNERINKICVRIVNIIVPMKSARKKLREKLYNYLLEALKDELGKKYPDYYQFAMFQPWGDFYIPCALFEEFKKRNSNAKILAVCVNENQRQVLQSFKAIDKVIKIDSAEYYALFSINSAQKCVQKLAIGKLYCLSHWLFADAVNNKSVNFLELYAKMLGLKYPISLSAPSFSLKLKQDYSNTILIYPETRSFTDRELSEFFWIELAQELKSTGYDILFNTKKDAYGPFKTIFLPMMTLIQIAKQCECVIGIRSGFSDILAINKIKNHIVIYPKSPYFKTITKEQQEREFSRAFIMDEKRTFEENMYRITSLNMFNGLTTEFRLTDTELLKQRVKDYVFNLKHKDMEEV